MSKPPEMWRHTDFSAFAASIKDHNAPGNVQFALTIVHNYMVYYATQNRIMFSMFLIKVKREYFNSHKPLLKSSRH